MGRSNIVAVAIVVALAFATDVYMNRYQIVSGSAFELNRITGVVCAIGSGRCAEFGGKFWQTDAQ